MMRMGLRRALLTGMLCLFATAASAAITSVSPSTFSPSGEDYLQIFGDSDNSNPGGFQNNPLEIFDVYRSNHSAIKTSSAYWTNDFPGGGHSGAEIHGALDEYNNFGSVDGTGYAIDCDTQQFASAMTGFSLGGSLGGGHDMLIY